MKIHVCVSCQDPVEVLWPGHMCWVCHWIYAAQEDDIPPLDCCLWHSGVERRVVGRWLDSTGRGFLV